MKDSHQHLMITPEWDAFLNLQQTLDKFAVPQAEQAEIKRPFRRSMQLRAMYHQRQFEDMPTDRPLVPRSLIRQRFLAGGRCGTCCLIAAQNL
jgi:hypothetical protein